MKLTKYVLSAVALLTLASCGGASSQPAGTSSEETSEVSSEPAPTFENFTLEKLHEARTKNELPGLDKKYISIKGKVTFAKRPDENYNALFIQSGKYAVEVAYPEDYTVNVGDSVEVKGRFHYFKHGEVDTISVSTYKDICTDFSIKVIDEAIQVEDVTIEKDSDLIEFNGSQSHIAFSVTGNRKNAAFLGKLSKGDKEYIVSNMLGVAEKFPEDPYVEGDNVRYAGVFTFAGDSSAWVLRYADREGFSKAN